MTMPHVGWWVGITITLGGITACDADESAMAPEVVAKGFDSNGFRLNGFRLNGFRLNGFRLDESALSGGGDAIRLEGIRLAEDSTLASSQVTSAWLEGSDLHVRTAVDKDLSGPELTGAEFVFSVLEDGVSDTKLVRIAGVDLLAPGSDIWIYDLELRTESDEWEPLCLDGKGDPTEAILLDGAWDGVTGDRVPLVAGRALTFACRDAALAKCVEWGYRPWASVDGVSLADYHQACTRAVRADYCGDGVPHTHNGVEIHVLDELGIQVVEGEYAVEAEWGPNGAICLDPAHTRLPAPEFACELPLCGEAFAFGGLIQTGVPS